MTTIETLKIFDTFSVSTKIIVGIIVVVILAVFAYWIKRLFD